MSTKEVKNNLAWAKRVRLAGYAETNTLSQLLAAALLDTSCELLSLRALQKPKKK